jgi:hypothetical protein
MASMTASTRSWPARNRSTSRLDQAPLTARAMVLRPSRFTVVWITLSRNTVRPHVDLPHRVIHPDLGEPQAADGQLVGGGLAHQQRRALRGVQALSWSKTLSLAVSWGFRPRVGTR